VASVLAGCRTRLGRVARVAVRTIRAVARFTGFARGQSYWDLLVYSTIAGLGLGGEFGIGWRWGRAFCHAAKERDAARLVLVGIGWKVGVMDGRDPDLRPQRVLQVIGLARGRFLIGILPAVARPLHPPAHARAGGFLRDARTRRPRQIIRQLLVKDAETLNFDRPWGRDSSAGADFGYYGVMIWMTNYLSTRFGSTRRQTAVWTTATNRRHGVGIIRVRPLRRCRRPKRRLLHLKTGAGHHRFVLVSSRLTIRPRCVCRNGVMGFFVNGMLGGHGALMRELYPTAARATAKKRLLFQHRPCRRAASARCWWVSPTHRTASNSHQHAGAALLWSSLVTSGS